MLKAVENDLPVRDPPSRDEIIITAVLPACKQKNGETPCNGPTGGNFMDSRANPARLPQFGTWPRDPIAITGKVQSEKRNLLFSRFPLTPGLLPFLEGRPPDGLP